jgi:predicted enzyme related to lactoylglutathione lyase
MKLKHEQIQYIEFLSEDLERIRLFYEQCFSWQFTAYGPSYLGFESDYIDGGFTIGKPVKGSVLVILYSQNLEVSLKKVMEAGGRIIQPIFAFPGGRRFHFEDPDGNELAVWG